MTYFRHRNFDQYANPSDIIVWRYFKLSTLESMLKYRTLRFNKITEWKDAREGHVEPYTIETLSKQLELINCEQHIVDALNKSRDQAKHKVFGCCWCVNEHENNLMWDTYGRSENKNVGVAVKTTLDKLYASITDENNIYSGNIIYEKFPFTPKYGNIYIDCVVKDIQYQDEREHRLFFIGDESDTVENITYKDIKIDTSQLLNEIYINPESNDEDYKSVFDTIKESDSNLHFTLNRSSILNKPRPYSTS